MPLWSKATVNSRDQNWRCDAFAFAIHCYICSFGLHQPFNNRCYNVYLMSTRESILEEYATFLMKKYTRSP